MDSIKSQEILNGNLSGSAKKLQLDLDRIFQQHNDPKLASKFTQKLFIGHRIESPIGNLWFELKSRDRIWDSGGEDII